MEIVGAANTQETPNSHFASDMEPEDTFDRPLLEMLYEFMAEVHLEKLIEVEKTAALNKIKLSGALSIVDITKDAFNKSIIEFIKSLKAFPGFISSNKAVKAVVSSLKKYQTAATIANALHEKNNVLNEERYDLYQRHKIEVKQPAELS